MVKGIREKESEKNGIGIDKMELIPCLLSSTSLEL